MADGAGKTEIYMDMYSQMDKDDRLSAGWTLGEYRKAYSQAFVSAIKEVDSAWTYGKAIPSGVLEGITRELVEVRNCREIICIFLESMLIYVMNEFSDSGGHFHGT